MGVCCGHKHIGDGQTRFLMNPSFCFIKNFSFNGYVVHHHENQFCITIIKHQSSGMQLVMHMRCGRRDTKIPHDPLPQTWRDIADRSPSPKLPGTWLSTVWLSK